MIDARALTLELGGRWWQRYGTAPCPHCQPEGRKDQNALSLTGGTDGRLLLHCKKSACEFRQILQAANVVPGEYASPVQGTTMRQQDRLQRAEKAKRERQARSLWYEAQPIEGTPAETYLRRRGITCMLPLSLRYHPRCWHGATASQHPAMVSMVEGSESFAVHRTYLQPDGCGKAVLDPSKTMLGPVAGGAVRLSDGQDVLAVAEGIETALSLSSGLLQRPATVWATLSSSGLRGLRLPIEPMQLIIASDGDPAGHQAAQVLANRAHGAGWTVTLMPAPEGLDWNDVLIRKGHAA